MFDLDSRRFEEELKVKYEELKDRLAEGMVPPERYNYTLGFLRAIKVVQEMLASAKEPDEDA